MNDDFTAWDRVMYMDKDGKPLKLLEWAKLLEDTWYRFIARDKVRGHDISTV